ncbi:hypothetical protein QJS10_CPA01g02491 [Acorus calamus]|uniref:Uncharacterized protein n=1 Tax=Acorus calamus TaxID=4465 RepID=A0AAV9FK77_ACOCL|nr:hypothetical protein QJS10_CPA01g02491 [Acorus calamus]
MTIHADELEAEVVEASNIPSEGEAGPSVTEGDPGPESKPEPEHKEIEKEIRSEGAEEPSQASSNAIGRSDDLDDGEGSRTLTMRELLSELKEDRETPKAEEVLGRNTVAGGQDRSSSQSQDSLKQHLIAQNDVAMELINSVTGVDEEGRSRQRILAFAAKRYASAIERNPEDHDAFYNWALVLQESADNVGPDSNSASKDALLEEACKKYDEATRLCPTLHDAYYNWAIAISDRAKMRGRTKEAEELWKQATKNYEKAVQLNWNSPQALNNWGLALQELSAIVPAREKQTIVRTAISKYGLAEDTFRSGRPFNTKEVSPDELYSQSAIYIAAAHALKPNYSLTGSTLIGDVVIFMQVYRSALRLVRSMVGYLTTPPAGNPIAPHCDWERSQFVLNHEGLQQLFWGNPQNKSAVKVDVPDIVRVSACADLTLPPGAGLCIDTTRGPFFLVADTWESLDGWLDAIRLVYTIYARGKSDVLAGIVTG